ITKKDEARLVRYLHKYIYNPARPPTLDIWNVFGAPNGINKDDWEQIAIQFLALGYWEALDCERSHTDLSSRKIERVSITVRGFKLTALGLRRHAEAKAIPKNNAENPKTQTIATMIAKNL